MAKTFNTTAVCIPEEHYMVNIDERLKEIKGLVDEGKYFTINKARQYGKTTTCAKATSQVGACSHLTTARGTIGSLLPIVSLLILRLT